MLGRLFGRKREVPPFSLPAEENCVTRDSGVRYEMLREGTGKPGGGWHLRRVKIHHAGWTMNGELFDSSYERGKPEWHAINGVIKGWSEMVQLMKVGGVAVFVVPPVRAYGKLGRAPLVGPNESLVFRIELLAVE